MLTENQCETWSTCKLGSKTMVSVSYRFLHFHFHCFVISVNGASTCILIGPKARLSRKNTIYTSGTIEFS